MGLLLGGIRLEGILCIHAGKCMGGEEEDVRIWGSSTLRVGSDGRQLVNARLRILHFTYSEDWWRL